MYKKEGKKTVEKVRLAAMFIGIELQIAISTI